MAIVIAAFPGCGKSTYYNANSIYANGGSYKNDEKRRILDSDSSLFSWIYDDFGNKSSVRNPAFPKNYIEHIKKELDNQDIIFVSTHDNVRTAMLVAGIQYVLVYPHQSMKDEWIRRYEERGNNEAFIKLINDNWDNWIDGLRMDPTPYKIELSYRGEDASMTAITDYVIAIAERMVNKGGN